MVVAVVVAIESFFGRRRSERRRNRRQKQRLWIKHRTTTLRGHKILSRMRTLTVPQLQIGDFRIRLSCRRVGRRSGSRPRLLPRTQMRCSTWSCLDKHQPFRPHQLPQASGSANPRLRTTALVAAAQARALVVVTAAAKALVVAWVTVLPTVLPSIFVTVDHRTNVGRRRVAAWCTVVRVRLVARELIQGPPQPPTLSSAR